MTEWKEIRYHSFDDDGFAVITFARKNKGNAITPEMGAEIEKAIYLAEQNVYVRAVVLTGEGKYFCTGMDLGNTNQNQLENDLKSGTAAQKSLQLFECIKRSKKPTIALINGPVFGGGCGIVFVCDIRIAVESAFLCFSEVKRGLVPALISAYIVPQVGEYLSTQYMLTGMKLHAKELLERGLISKVVTDANDLMNSAKVFIDEIKSCAPNAVSATKENVQFCAANDFNESKKHVQSVFAKFIHSEEAMYGLSCFMQKQNPDWRSFSESKQRLHSNL